MHHLLHLQERGGFGEELGDDLKRVVKHSQGVVFANALPGANGSTGKEHVPLLSPGQFSGSLEIGGLMKEIVFATAK
ncbi:hypothetical protein NPIL_374571 [Nephila pilipes]|uniref:Uncharacterized protein n=1 Tax=Nephila pilipes TaxID=299642 RepID=A0A8X6TC67_NEPPI|nr:hypothetical protein NPIL_374571 [Nephila pilipes]